MAVLHGLLRAAEWPLHVSAAHTVLLVTAHPDDETLFFLPALQGLQAAGARFAILCLSTGDSLSMIFLVIPICSVSCVCACRQRGGVRRNTQRGAQSCLWSPERKCLLSPVLALSLCSKLTTHGTRWMQITWRWLTTLLCRHASLEEAMPFHQLSCIYALSRAWLIWYHHRMASVFTGTLPLYPR